MRVSWTLSSVGLLAFSRMSPNNHSALGPGHANTMVRVRIDLPLFYSSTEAFGSVTGEIDVDAHPLEGEVFPWPKSWIEDGPAYLAEADQSRIWGVHPWDRTPAEHLVTMFGFVCASASDARDYAAFLQRVGGLDLDEYGPLRPATEA